MNRIKSLIIPLVLSLFLLPSVAVFAQQDSTASDDPVLYDTAYDDYNYDYDWNSLDSSLDSSSTDLTDAEAAAASAFAFLFAGIWFVVVSFLAFGMYIFTSFALMKIGQKLGYENSWFAWIPILNTVMLFQLGDQNPWLVLLVLIPGIGAIAVAVITVIAYMKISEKRGFDKLLGLLCLVPVANIVLLGVLAWKDNNQSAVAAA